MKKLSVVMAALISTFALSAFSSQADASPVKLRKISRITEAQEPTTQHLIKSLKAAIEKDCRALSKNDTVEILSEKIVSQFSYGGRTVVTGKAGCSDLDLPCSAAPTASVGGMTLRALDVVLVRKSGGQRYYIKASTQWDLDLPSPQVDIRLDSKYCQ